MLHALLRGTAALLLAVLVAPFGWALATGDTFMTVTSGSMEPTYHVGDVIVVREAAGDELREVGTVVVATFGTSDRDSRYVHRVDEVLDDGAWLRGDNNSERDPQPVTQAQVEGTPRLALTGAVADAFTASQTPAGRAVLAVAALLLLFIPTGARPRPAAAQHDVPAEVG